MKDKEVWRGGWCRVLLVRPRFIKHSNMGAVYECANCSRRFFALDVDIHPDYCAKCGAKFVCETWV